MADFADEAADLQAHEIEMALRARRPTGIAPTGSCHYCHAKLSEPGAHFCDEDCAHDWDAEQRIRRNQGSRQAAALLGRAHF